MKRTRVIALVLCAAVMFMGAGYAYWTDTLTINNTVTTGEMDVIFTAADLTSVGLDNYQVPTVSAIGIDTKAITYSVTNMYPGAQVNYKATIKNDGTIPAVISGITITDDAITTMTDDEKAMLEVTGTIADYNVNTNLRDLNSVLNSESYRLEPQETIDVNLVLTVDADITGDTLEKETLKQVMTINWEQHNAQ